MTQLDVFPREMHLRRIEPQEDIWRFYSLEVTPDLFGGYALVRSWGRIGTPGRSHIELHADEGQALTALRRWQARKIMRGYEMV